MTYDAQRIAVRAASAAPNERRVRALFQLGENMKSQMRQAFEALHGFEVGDEMDIQTSVAWDNWKTAWRAGASHEREACANLCDRATRNDFVANGNLGWTCSVTPPDVIADAIRKRSNVEAHRRQWSVA